MRIREKGLTIVEVLIAIVIIGVVILGAARFQTQIFQITTGNDDKAFATQKAIQMFEELRSFVQANKEDTLNNLNNFSDGASYNYMLTTEVSTTDPGDALSENVKLVQVPVRWKYVRQVLIKPVPQDKNARHVTVNVYHADTDQELKPQNAQVPLATVSGILKTNIGPYPPTQVYDVYLLAVENVQGWWSDLSTLRPIFDTALNDLENRNPGLEFRVHYITRHGFGRDFNYAPYLNSTTDVASQDLPWIYFYPGKITPTNTSAATELYVNENINARKRDDTEFHHVDKTDDNGRDYAMADQFNHTMRYPMELAMYKRLNAQNTKAGEDELEPSTSMLLEGLNTDPEQYRNVIIVNLHGELLPVPPVRNYSDAAKIPDTNPNIRVVTHPQNLQYSNDTTVRLRVYPYQTVGTSGTLGTDTKIRKVSLFIPTDGKGRAYDSYDTEDSGFLAHPDFSPTLATAQSAITVSCIRGSSNVAYTQVTGASIHTNVSTMNLSSAAGATSIRVPSAASYAVDRLIVINPNTATEEVRLITALNSPSSNYLTLDSALTYAHTSGQQVAFHKDFDVSVNPTIYGQTVNGIHINLYNSPTRHGYHSSSTTGLPTARQLYRQEYIPAPVTNTLTSNYFANNLTTANSADAKNTARWIVNLNTASFGNDLDNQLITVETRMDSSATGSTATGTLLEQGMSEDGDVYRPDDLSTTNDDEHDTTLRVNPYNVSHTYVYMGTKTRPMVERYQFQGDARFMPYLDVKTVHGYNWFFYRHDSGNNGFFGGSSTATGGYTGFDRKQNPGWDNNDADIARYYQVYRDGLMTSNAIFNSMTGYSNYYYGIGGEVGGDNSNTLYNLRYQLWSDTDQGSTTKNVSDTAVNEIIGATRIPMDTGENWYALPWLGETHPDSVAQFWEENGNLPSMDYNSTIHKAGPTNTNTRFYRAFYDTAPLDLYQTRLKRTKETGCATFFNGNSTGTGNNLFNHIYADGKSGTLTKSSNQPGRNLADAFNLALPDSISASRPFVIDTNTTSPPEYTQTEYSSVRNKLTFINPTSGTTETTPSTSNRYYYRTDVTTDTVSSLVKITRNSDANLGAYVLVNGLDKQISGEVGAIWMARYTQAGVLQAFMDSGDLVSPGNTASRTVQIPRLEITSPDPSLVLEDPDTVSVKFDMSWKRWDNRKYSPAYSSTWYDEKTLWFNAKYSSDNGKTWSYINSSDEVTDYYLDHFNPDHTLFNTAQSVNGVTEFDIDWDTSGLAAGNYMLRLDTYRDAMEGSGYAYHQILVSIER